VGAAAVLVPLPQRTFFEQYWPRVTLAEVCGSPFPFPALFEPEKRV
jgi:hypothetical protein